MKEVIKAVKEAQHGEVVAINSAGQQVANAGAITETMNTGVPLYKEVDGKIIFNYNGAARAEGESFADYKERQKLEKQLEKIKRHPNNNVFHNSREYGTYVKEKN